ncbi:MAG TPA: orotidine 5'-phosphate decarboxylase, partial [Lachnospiraceae bacterium]|nr:orotidine 5'-phosphate decarboxylase [Lachnospiraceae bacterium]
MINTLIKKIEQLEAPLVVGLDPMLNFIPEPILQRAYSEKGENL